MRYIFKFPDIGEGVHEGKILKWHVEKGQRVAMGDPVVQVETDKVVADIPAPRDGAVVDRFGAVGEIINVGDALIELEIEGVAGAEAQAIAAEKPKPRTQEPVDEAGFGVVGTIEVAGDAAVLPAGSEGLPAAPVAPEAAPRRKALATPVSRAMARELGVDIDQVAGTGPGGRVMKSDIQAHYDRLRTAAPAPAPAAAPAPDVPRVEYEPLSMIRKAIARNMAVSKGTAAHMTVIDEVEVSALVALRRDHKDRLQARGVSLTYLPFVLKAVAGALKRHRSLNSQLDLENNRMVYQLDVNIGIAVDTDDGLVVPVIRHADRLSILELAARIQEFAARARERKLTLDDFKGGTFTVTNYGAIGGLFGVPVINYPQAAILGIGRVVERPVVKDGQLAVGRVMPLSLSVDHRIVDGGATTRFLNDVMASLREPVGMLLGE
ncbi:MAG TPA: dihydrolipoamide acetyltransferase family protein [Acidobacteriota bacterium]|nr:2-oxo acid dehydrogenase subunit E2 [Acidobacteriota bacterium]HOT00238.1 dihydrolipoamide acetyltransferase family protein [Acidobacteriota bacterium]HQF87792.1 dihydrolipoamide acetyltransferase family protein [Acidobacteriota bacterium]HQG92508.1 dihydrolipoamide acetyltransferase family protein [Acidobacteriota bacterium]HQK86992.1 dihydrolipoamide acetyltransferase family protein [Acidobacteriota bacterium]